MSSEEEKGDMGPSQFKARSASTSEEAVGPIISENKDSFATRYGFNLTSFKKKESGADIELERPMKTRHLHMISIGGSIGAGFFVGSGGALAKGGPASLLIDFAIIGVMMFNVVYALGEMAVMFPVSGGFYTLSTRFIDPSWGFAMGWNYVFQWAIVLPLELTVCGMVMQYWNADISVGIWITVFLLLITIVMMFGAIGFAEEEFWAASIKLAAIIIFMVTAFVLVLGGGPSDGQYNTFQGSQTWQDPGAFRNGFRGFCAIFVTAAFSFSGTELVGLAAAEAKNPVRSLPGAIKQVFWRITLFYILGLLFVGLLIRSDDPRLLGSGKEGPSSGDVSASPFVLIGEYAGLTGFNHFINAVIVISVMSIGVSGVYGGSRTLTAMAQFGYAPKIFTYIDRAGRPTFSVGIILVCGLLAYINLSADGAMVFNWLLALSGLAALFTWGSICLAHIRFRKAWAYHGHGLDEIPFRAIGGVYGSWLGLILCVLVLVATMFSAICPPGQEGYGTAEDFFMAMLALPVVMLFWVVGYFWKRSGWLRTVDMDVDTGRREHDWEEINRYKARVAAMPTWRRLIWKWFV